MWSASLTFGTNRNHPQRFATMVNFRRKFAPSFRDAPAWAQTRNPAPCTVLDSGFAPKGAPRNDLSPFPSWRTCAFWFESRLLAQPGLGIVPTRPLNRAADVLRAG